MILIMLNIYITYCQNLGGHVLTEKRYSKDTFKIRETYSYVIAKYNLIEHTELHRIERTDSYFVVILLPMFKMYQMKSLQNHIVFGQRVVVNHRYTGQTY